MRVVLLRDISIPAGPSYRKGQLVFTVWTEDNRIILGGKDGIPIDFGIDYLPYWDTHYLRDRMRIKAPTVKEKR
jgi:hypothetical protein